VPSNRTPLLAAPVAAGALLLLLLLPALPLIMRLEQITQTTLVKRWAHRNRQPAKTHGNAREWFAPAYGANVSDARERPRQAWRRRCTVCSARVRSAVRVAAAAAGAHDRSAIRCRRHCAV
jgi:hypothetical protein